MRVSIKVALLIGLFAGMATVGEYSLLNAAHASSGQARNASAVNTKLAIAGQAITKQQSTAAQNDDCDSYVDVLNAIEQDPEHAQAKMITASYDINN